MRRKKVWKTMKNRWAFGLKFGGVDDLVASVVQEISSKGQFCWSDLAIPGGLGRKLVGC